MKEAMAVIFIASAITITLSNYEFSALVMIFSVLCVYLGLLMRDAWCLIKYIKSISLKEKHIVFMPWTIIGNSILRHLLNVQVILQTSDWKEERIKRESAPISEDNFEINLDFNEADRDQRQNQFLTKLLENITSKFRCEACAIITYDEFIEDKLRISLSYVGGHYNSNPHLEKAIKFFFLPVFVNGETWQFGMRDGHQSSTPFGEFSTFGFRYSISYPFVITSQESGETRGVIWLGYSKNKPPIKEEEGWLKKLVRDLQHKFKSTQRIYELSSKIENAKRSEDDRRKFMAHASHDIRSPLNNLKAILNLFALEEGMGNFKELIEAALSSCNQMNEIVDDILNFSKHQSGILRADISRFDIVEALSELLDIHKVSARLKELDFNVKLDKPVYYINGDKLQIKRVFNNLICNAIKYTKSGSVSVSIRSTRKGFVTFAVEDSGVGISKLDQVKLFSPFTRLSDEKVDGIGLGLALSKILVELNGGSIEVLSEINKGSCFSVNFALSDYQEQPDLKTDDIKYIPVTHMDFTSYGNILIVDDDPRCVDSLSRNLVKIGISVTRCYSVSDAISIINYEAPSAIISDINMPDGGGKKIALFLNQNQLPIPLLLLSGLVEQEEATYLRSLGVKDIFLKNVEFSQIRNWLENNLASVTGTEKSEVEVKPVNILMASG